jgi:hypothetical protein
MKTDTFKSYKERLAKYNPNDYPAHVWSQMALCLLFGKTLKGSGSFVAAGEKKH